MENSLAPVFLIQRQEKREVSLPIRFRQRRLDNREIASPFNRKTTRELLSQVWRGDRL